MSLSKIKTALIGFGTSGEKFHTPLLRALPSFEITHIVSSRKEQIQSAFPKGNITILDSTQVNAVFLEQAVDLVIISAPNTEHYSLAKSALLHPKYDSAETPLFRAGRKRCSSFKVENKINPNDNFCR